MKYLFSGLLVILIIVSGKAQRIDSASVARLSPELRDEVNNYLVQAKKAHNTGMILSIGGAALALVGSIIFETAYAKDMENLFSDPYSNDNSSTENVGAVLMLTGVASALGSIPFFLKVHKKRNAARAIVFANKGMSLTPNLIVPGTQSAGVGLVIELGRKR